MVPPEITGDPLSEVAARFKRQRQIERFTQAEIAEAIGVTRPLISHFEQGVARLSFSAGYAFCRRADLNPRWLATGVEPQRPFVPLDELGVSESDIEAQTVRGVDFLAGYAAVLKAPLDKWAKSVTIDDLIERQLEGSLTAYARRCSDKQLLAEIDRWAKELRSDHFVTKAGALVNLHAMLEVFGERLKKESRSVAKYLPKPHGGRAGEKRR